MFGILYRGLALAGLGIVVGATMTPAMAQDITCFATRDNGASCLTGDGVKHFNRASGHLRNDRVGHVIACNGKVLIGAGRSVFSFDGTELSKIGDVTAGSISRLACSPNGFWTVGGRYLHEWTGDGFKVHDGNEILADERTKSFNDVAIHDGTAYFVAFGGLAGAITDGKATLYRRDEHFAKHAVLNRIFVTASGAVYIPHGAGLYALRDGKWTNLAGAGATGGVVEDKDGALWLAGGTRLVRFADGAWKTAKLDYAARDLAIDGQGRIWIASEFGLGVMDGGKWARRQMHNSEVGSNEITAVATLGNGGPVLEEKEQAKGSLKGRLEWTDGEPIKNAEVVICGISRGMFSKSPCDGQPLAAATKTDNDGRFEFKNIGSSSYRFSMKRDGGERWLRILLGFNRMRVMPGADQNAGTIRVNVNNRDK